MSLRNRMSHRRPSSEGRPDLAGGGAGIRVHPGSLDESQHHHSSVFLLETEGERLDGSLPGLGAEPLESALSTNPWSLLAQRSGALEHPMRIQARQVVCAFSALARGVTASEWLKPLQALPDDSPFRPYGQLAQAQRALSQGDLSGARALAAVLESDAAVGAAARILQRLAGGARSAPTSELRQDEHEPAEHRAVVDWVQGYEGVRRWLGALDGAWSDLDPQSALQSLGGGLRELQRLWPALARVVQDEVALRWLEQGWPPRGLCLLLGLPPGSPELLRYQALVLGPMHHKEAAFLWLRYSQQAALPAPKRAAALAEAAERLLQAPGYCPSCGMIHEPSGVQTSLFPGLTKKLRQSFEGAVSEDGGRLARSAGGREGTREGELSPLTLLTDAILLDPRAAYYARLVEVLELRGEAHGVDAALHEAIQQVLERWIQVHPDDVEGLLRLARLSQKRGATRRALLYAQRAEQLVPHSREIQGMKLGMLLSSAIRRMRQRRPHLMLLDAEAMSQLHGLDGLLRPLQVALQALAWELSPAGQGRSDTLMMVGNHTGDPVSAFLLVHDLVGMGAHPGFRMTLKLDPEPSAALRKVAMGLSRYEAWKKELSLPGLGVGEVLRRVVKRLPVEPVAVSADDLVILCRAAGEQGRSELLLRLTRDALVLGSTLSPSQLLLFRADALTLSGCAARRIEDCLSAAYTLALKESTPAARQRVESWAFRRVGDSPQGIHLMARALIVLSDEALEQVLLRERALGPLPGLTSELAIPGTRRGRKRKPLLKLESPHEPSTVLEQ